MIVRACEQDSRVKGLQLSRNFGHHSAITAGLAHPRGRYVVVMDSDLQDDPEYIQDLYRKARDGFDIVFARKAYAAFQPVAGRCHAVVLRDCRLALGELEACRRLLGRAQGVERTAACGAQRRQRAGQQSHDLESR